jgi:hypothetical protein
VPSLRIARERVRQSRRRHRAPATRRPDIQPEEIAQDLEQLIELGVRSPPASKPALIESLEATEPASFDVLERICPAIVAWLRERCSMRSGGRSMDREAAPRVSPGYRSPARRPCPATYVTAR